MGHCHGESEPAVRLICVLDMGGAGREPPGQVDSQTGCAPADFEIEVITFTDKVQNALALRPRCALHDRENACVPASSHVPGLLLAMACVPFCSFANHLRDLLAETHHFQQRLAG
jgi:hypothetical protein